jgi:Holliday junction resolvase RusA-like endonuclease
MAILLDIFVEGEPKAQPRPRAFARKFGNKYSARVYDAGTAEGWKGLIAQSVRPHLAPTPHDVPLRVDIDFYFHRPGRLLRKRDPDGAIPHTSKPDRDNLDKAVMDALTQIQFWRDDGQACEGTIRKFYAAKGARAGAAISIQTLV